MRKLYQYQIGSWNLYLEDTKSHVVWVLFGTSEKPKAQGEAETIESAIG
jgi:hypothetical protein